MNNESPELYPTLINLLEAANVDTISIPLNLLQKYSESKSNLHNFVTSEVIDGMFVLFKRLHYDPCAADDFKQLFICWMNKDLHMVAKYLIPFSVEVIEINHNSNLYCSNHATDELVGSSLFYYAAELTNK